MTYPTMEAALDTYIKGFQAGTDYLLDQLRDEGHDALVDGYDGEGGGLADQAATMIAGLRDIQADYAATG